MRIKNATPKAAAAIMSAMAALSMAAPAMAATNYTLVSGSKTSFKKFLVMSRGDQCPNVTFSYTVTAGEAVSTPTNNNSVFQVIPGPSANLVTVTSTQFAASDTSSAKTSQDSGDIDVARAASARATGRTAETGVEFETSKGEKYVTKTAEVDFSAVNFDEPGIYRYIITETASATDEAAGIMHDNDVDRVLDVYVTDDGSGTLVVSQYVMHTDINSAATPAIDNVDPGNMGTIDVNSDGAALGDKTDGFTNEYKSKDLEFKKAVTGNQASRDKYFEFTLNLTNLNPNGEYIVSIGNDSDNYTNDGNADATSGSNSATIAANAGKTNSTKLTANAQGAVNDQKFYLQHGQTLVVRGLPLNGTYNLTENAEDYKSTQAGAEGYGQAVSGTVGTVAGSEKLIKTSYLNTRAGNIPTGVLASIIPGLALVGVGGAGFLASRKRRKEEE